MSWACRSLFSVCVEEDEMAVLEMGIDDFGQMHRLAKIARPETAVITNIGWCHLENLKTRDGILQAKPRSLIICVRTGNIIINGDDDKLSTVERFTASAGSFRIG